MLMLKTVFSRKQRQIFKISDWWTWSGVACGWSVVESDHDEELGPLHEIYGAMDAEFEVQRTIKRAELTAFFCLLKKRYWTHQSACRQKRNH